MARIQGAPVWHVNESIDRLLLLCNGDFSRVCVGSAGDYAVIGTPRWTVRMYEAMNALVERYGRIPVWLHMLRGMSLAGSPLPFASVDSSDLARNHNRGVPIELMADRWDVKQCPGEWAVRACRQISMYPPMIAGEDVATASETEVQG